MKYAIIAEDRSDAEVLAILVKRLYAVCYPKKKAASVAKQGYHGWGDLCRKGAAELGAFYNVGCQRFIVCLDADQVNPKPRYDFAYNQIIKKAKIPAAWCIVVPVQELEAWVLADIEQVSMIIASWQPKAIANPEKIKNPKEYLRGLSRDPTTKHIRYREPRDNVKMANHLRTEIVAAKCKAFRSLVDFVNN